MLTRSSPFQAWVSIALAGLALGHQCIFHEAMYCVNGTTPGVVNYNNDAPVAPAYNLPYSEFWMHHFNGCDEFPPDEGVFMELPAGQSITLEIAGNRAFTTLNPNAVLTAWGDGGNHPDDWNVPTCITNPNLHTQNESMAAGTALAISYESNIKNVTPENLVVFTVRYNTPFKRLVTYDIPSGMPACPDAGCICTFLWIPDNCGIANMYMFPYACKVVPDSTTPKTIGTPKPATFCEGNSSACVQGPKQMLIWHQQEANNIEVEGWELSGAPKSPAYNAKCGFMDGAQNDIFVESGASAVSNTNTSTTSSPPATSTTASLPPVGSSTQPSMSPVPSSPTTCKRSVLDADGTQSKRRRHRGNRLHF